MVKVELSEAEAIVLFEMLNRLVDGDRLSDDAETQAATALIDRLEGGLPIVAGVDYALRLARARGDQVDILEIIIRHAEGVRQVAAIFVETGLDATPDRGPLEAGCGHVSAEFIADFRI